MIGSVEIYTVLIMKIAGIIFVARLMKLMFACDNLSLLMMFSVFYFQWKTPKTVDCGEREPSKTSPV